MKGVSPLISTVLLVGIIVLMATIVGPWMVNIATQTSQSSGQDVEQDMICRRTSYDFDGDYGNSGITWTANQTNGTVTAKIINTGTQNLYNFSIQLTMQTPDGIRLIQYPNVNITLETRKTAGNPVKPGEEWILEADVTEVNDTWSLMEVKVINDVCPRISPSIDT